MSGGVSRKQRRRLTSVDYLVFVIGVAVYVNIAFIGVLTLADILLSVLFVYFAFRRKFRVESRLARIFLILGLLWLTSQIATDLIRHTTFVDYARGWSNIGLTLVNFSVLCTLLYGRPGRLMLFGWGTVAGQILMFCLSPNDFQIDHPWKFGVAYPLSLAVALIASHRSCRDHWPGILMAVVGVVHIFMDARNAGAVCLAAGFYLSVNRYMRRRNTLDGQLKKSRIIAMTGVLALGAVGIFWSYQFAARSGLMGEDAREKFTEQSSGRFGVLLGGREELLATIPAIIDSPILGHGSWAKNPVYLLGMRQALFLLGYHGALNLSPEDLTEGLIPSHSFLFGAWVYAGILGALLWAWVWLMIIVSLTRIYPEPAVLLPFMAYVSFLLLWDILFSPYGLDRRCQVPFYLLMIITYCDMAKRSAVQVAAVHGKGVLKPALSSGD